VQKELDTMRCRNTELTALFKRLYEDNMLGRVTSEQFQILSGDYNAEQSIRIIYRSVDVMDSVESAEIHEHEIEELPEQAESGQKTA